jgi:hypothetical protein
MGVADVVVDVGVGEAAVGGCRCQNEGESGLLCGGIMAPAVFWRFAQRLIANLSLLRPLAESRKDGGKVGQLPTIPPMVT